MARETVSILEGSMDDTELRSVGLVAGYADLGIRHFAVLMAGGAGSLFKRRVKILSEEFFPLRLVGVVAGNAGVFSGSHIAVRACQILRFMAGSAGKPGRQKFFVPGRMGCVTGDALRLVQMTAFDLASLFYFFVTCETQLVFFFIN
jgi:hypothetical protein